MKNILAIFIIGFFAAFSSGCALVEGGLKEEVRVEHCEPIGKVKVCEATAAYWVQGKLQEKLNVAFKDERISEETHAKRSLDLRKANGLIIAWEAGRDDAEEALNILEESYKYLISIGFSAFEVFN